LLDSADHGNALLVCHESDDSRLFFCAFITAARENVDAVGSDAALAE
jgi:hypothetical protein